MRLKEFETQIQMDIGFYRTSETELCNFKVSFKWGSDYSNEEIVQMHIEWKLIPNTKIMWQKEKLQNFNLSK